MRFLLGLCLFGMVIFAIEHDAGNSSPTSDFRSGIADDAQPPAKPPRWANVPYPDMYDTTRLAFDKNSVTSTFDDKGNISEVNITARVVAGDVSILGKEMILTFGVWEIIASMDRIRFPSLIFQIRKAM